MSKKDGLMSFYRGLKMACVATIASFGSYFFCYRLFKNLVTAKLGIKEFDLKSKHIMLITALAGAISSAFANPFWLVNTRLTLAKKKKSIMRTFSDTY